MSAENRLQHLAAMADRALDVLVIGGGITGAGVALDAAARGLSVGLVEREDFASGTSGRSSRLVHGGARYLRHGELGLVYESLRERERLRRLAPHLVRPLGFLIPIRRPANRLYMGTGLALYDALTVGRNPARHRWATPDDARRLAPTLLRASGGYLAFDCRTDDARLTLEVVRQAAARGALVANHAEVEDLLGDGRVRGATVRDRISGGSLDVRAGVVVNATGVWASRVHAHVVRRPPALRPSKGVHVVLPRSRLPVRCAVTVPSVAGGGAMVFAIPWGPRVYAGTTDTPYDGPLPSPTVEREDVEVVLGSLARAFEGDLGPADVRASWAGVRPLLDTRKGATRDLSRRHVIYEDPPRLLTVTGGKLTTYRRMAEQVVDRACEILAAGGRCPTRRLPLGLTVPYGQELERAAAAARSLGLGPDAGRRLVGRYGDDWSGVLDLVRDDPGLGEEAVPGLPVLRVEIEAAIRREMALTGDDVLVRRTRLATMDAELAASVSGPWPAAGVPAEPRPPRR
ncbi:MAG TPA: glycerol-3-phosphate dehydrogenase/oxidase [Actinomycetota bacterium]|nr:glycerol-3-phosphate dehydrogenase/oxidase [Actinomycetota bacterium]